MNRDLRRSLLRVQIGCAVVMALSAIYASVGGAAWMAAASGAVFGAAVFLFAVTYSA